MNGPHIENRQGHEAQKRSRRKSLPLYALIMLGVLGAANVLLGWDDGSCTGTANELKDENPCRAQEPT